MITAKDIQNLLNQLNKDAEYIAYADKIVKENFERIKMEMLAEFDSHPVTREIEEGISANNISDTLNGVTNLYSFIGFNEGSKPIDPIREMLKSISYNRISQHNSAIKYVFSFPTAKDIFAITPMPWASGRSWAKGIEEGISGIGYYLKIVENSRSGLGIQGQKIVRPNLRFRNVKYISDLIRRYSQKIQKLEAQADL